MKRKSLWLIPVLVLLLAFSLSLTGCGNNNQPAVGSTDGDDGRWGEVHRWQMQTALPAGDGMADVLHWMVEDIYKMSGGRLVIEVLPDGAVVGATEVLNAVNAGVV